MTRRVVWLQLLIGWLPLWALFAALIIVMHGGHPHSAGFAALRMVLAAAALGLIVNRLAERIPWPRPIRPTFVLLHLVAAFAFSVAWLLLNSAIESAMRGALVVVVPYGPAAMIMLGVWLYVMVAGVSYSTQATERAAQAEAAAAKAQLAALRSQLNPHFLFNALHTVMHLIPREPKRAAQATEELAVLLRATVESDRDTAPLSDELAFVDKYLSIEHIRFGDRLRVKVDVSDDARDAMVPSFSVQSLVENAVRHAATPRVEATDIAITGRVLDAAVVITVSDDGAAGSEASTKGTGLRRLRERITALYGAAGKLDAGPSPIGWTATLTIPLEQSD